MLELSSILRLWRAGGHCKEQLNYNECHRHCDRNDKIILRFEFEDICSKMVAPIARQHSAAPYRLTKKPGAVSRPGTRPQFLFPDTWPDSIRQGFSIVAPRMPVAPSSKSRRMVMLGARGRADARPPSIRSSRLGADAPACDPLRTKKP
jgi:hypothetical protein